MTVKRVVANIATEQMDAARAFCGDVLGMSVAMDHGWIVTFVGSGQASPQISFASEGGSGTPVPGRSIEADDLNDDYQRVLNAGYSSAGAVEFKRLKAASESTRQSSRRWKVGRGRSGPATY